MEFASKAYFLLLLLLIPYILWYFLGRKKSEPTMRMSDTRIYQYAPKSMRVRLIHLPMVLRCICFVLIVIAMARPQTHYSWDNKTVEGIDIMLAMDVSTSMLAEDLKPNRMEAAKDVATEFISGRPTDNIGLTIFAGEAFTQCPMTTDHASLLRLLHDTRTDIAARGLIDDGTAVGMGLANAVTRLKDSKAKSKVVILLTDGSNNMGDISPMTAAEIAKKIGSHQSLYHWCGNQQGGALSDACGRRCTVCQYPGGNRYPDAARHRSDHRWKLLSSYEYSRVEENLQGH